MFGEHKKIVIKELGCGLKWEFEWQLISHVWSDTDW